MIMNVNNVITNLKYFREFQSLRLRFVLSAVALYEEKSARVLGLFSKALDFILQITKEKRPPKVEVHHKKRVNPKVPHWEKEILPNPVRALKNKKGGI